MEEKLKKQIIEDYKKALEEISRIASKGNWWVLKPHQYLSPTIRGNILPLDDKDGEFFHYNVICETLEKLLVGERVEYTCHFKDAPDEIKQLLDKVT